MAIQVRRENYSEFDPDRMLRFEWACVLADDPQLSDGKLFICSSAVTVGVKEIGVENGYRGSVSNGTGRTITT